ncbi:MAG: DUF255 domain-containing protein [Gammaproteobacteria bacterium]|nr:DUF255 domain-containing protein [Gammaproteobacteria bacterium]
MMNSHIFTPGCKLKSKRSSFRRYLATALLFFSAMIPLRASVELQPLSNQLKHHASPYLALHGNDPVHWQDWGGAVVARARAENKLIFISSGYFSCHWCHVMQRESYADKEVADLLNQLAVPVKVDRELHPALDSWLIDYTQRTNGYAGWPLNVFLTPDGYPLVALTYRPKKDFSELLQRLQNLWNNNEKELREMARKAFETSKPEPQTHSAKQPETGMDRDLAQLLVEQALQIGDETAGGFGQQSKFPMSPLLKNLLAVQASFPDEKLAAFLKLTLDQMAQLGLRDHIGGGFFRYTVDPAWDTPHFEKMLYDNAQLVDVYLSAAEVLHQPFYRQVALDTLDFVLETMSAPDGAPKGAYVASLSAVDNNNIEGGYYLWQIDELNSVLDKDELQIVSLIWGINGSPHLDAGFHARFVLSVEEAAAQLKLPSAEVSKKLEQARYKLQQARRQRQIPLDSKVLAAWNGLLLTSLSKAYQQTGDRRCRETGAGLYRVLTSSLWNGEQLHRFIHNGKPGGRVSLADYAYVSHGIAAWARATDDEQAWNTARKIAFAGLQRFHNDSGWQLSEELIIPYAARELVLADDTMPSPSATLLSVLYSIASRQQDNKLKQQVLQYLDVDFPAIQTSALWYGSQIMLIHQVLQKN